MKKIILISITIFTISLTSCVTSLYSLVTEDVAITDNRILGTWTGPEGVMSITPAHETEILGEPDPEPGMNPLLSRSYIISFQKNKKSYSMFASLVKIEDQLYVDIRPFISESEGMDMTKDYLPTSTIAKVKFEDKKMILQVADGDFVKEQVLNGRMRIKHESNELFNTFMITAPSSELQQFIRKYGHDDRLFSIENSVTLTRS